MSKSLIPTLILISLSLTACTKIIESIPGVYAVDIQQGNIFDQENTDQLRPNMNKRQVLYIMGSPMLRDVFHQNRWDYIYSDQPGGEARVQKRLSLYFEGDTLIGVQGDLRPSSVPVLRSSNEVTVEVPERILEKTMSEKIVDWFGLDDSNMPVKPEESVTIAPETEAGGELITEGIDEIDPEVSEIEINTDILEVEPTPEPEIETEEIILEGPEQPIELETNEFE